MSRRRPYQARPSDLPPINPPPRPPAPWEPGGQDATVRLNDDGSFSDAARAAIYSRDDHRCIACGRSSPLTAHHRTARGMGGTSRVDLGSPTNGLTLCGSGTTGCHGWVEYHRTQAVALGWLVPEGVDPATRPYLDRTYGWRLPLHDGLAVYVDAIEDVPEPVRDAARSAAEAFDRFRHGDLRRSA